MRSDLRRQLRRYILPLLHQLGAGSLYQIVRPEGIARGDVAGHGKYFAVLFHRQPRRNQRTGILGRFDYNHAQTQSADHAIAIRKVFRDRRRPQGELRHERAVTFQNVVSEFLVIARINLIEPRAHHSHRPSAGFQRAPVRCRVDTARHSGNDGHSALRKLARQHQGGVLPVGRATTRADDCHTWLVQTSGPCAFHIKHDRRVIGLAQQSRIDPVVEHQNLAAEFAHAFNFRFGALVQFAVSEALDSFRRQPQQSQFAARGIEDRFRRSEVFQQTRSHARANSGSHV